MVGGGLRYFVPLWVSLTALRAVGCSLPVEVFFPYSELPDDDAAAALAGLGARVREACDTRTLACHALRCRLRTLCPRLSPRSGAAAAARGGRWVGSPSNPLRSCCPPSRRCSTWTRTT